MKYTLIALIALITMQWEKFKGNSRKNVDRAGAVLINKESSEEDKSQALEVMNNWREIHKYPLHIFKKP